MLLPSIWESASPLCMDYTKLVFLFARISVQNIIFDEVIRIMMKVLLCDK